MKKIQPLDPNILCLPIKMQDEINKIFIPGQENRRGFIRKVVDVCPLAAMRGVAIGDLIVTRTPMFQELPVYLAEDDKMPFVNNDKVEVVDLGQITAVYKEIE